ncbi:hypothetical protein CAEBREN_19626 [Caenorhabditis brenneri]|uniref:Uncharacterized protein n=1 Tax=Caenorhabditis brenneri TaxID=135651 RepID=G0NDX5_CAEBE|nr:hypothetical protein CAEBREN_19626 [Caenorhabditis brenneri]
MSYTKRRVSKAQLDKLRRRSKKNALPSHCGSKPKNRFGKKGSSYDHTRRITDLSCLSIFGQPDTSASTTQTLSQSTRSPSPFVRASLPSYSTHNNTRIDQNSSSPGNSSNNFFFAPAFTSTPNKGRSIRGG